MEVTIVHSIYAPAPAVTANDPPLQVDDVDHCHTAINEWIEPWIGTSSDTTSALPSL